MNRDICSRGKTQNWVVCVCGGGEQLPLISALDVHHTKITEDKPYTLKQTVVLKQRQAAQ